MGCSFVRSFVLRPYYSYVPVYFVLQDYYMLGGYCCTVTTVQSTVPQQTIGAAHYFLYISARWNEPLYVQYVPCCWLAGQYHLACMVATGTVAPSTTVGTRGSTYRTLPPPLVFMQRRPPDKNRCKMKKMPKTFQSTFHPTNQPTNQPISQKIKKRVHLFLFLKENDENKFKDNDRQQHQQ